jgi:sarcosine oxidase subunit beta
VVGGGHRGIPDLDRDTSSVDFRQLTTSAATVGALFPVMRAAEIVRTWSGIESHLPDDIPIIGPVVGSLLAELIDTGATNLPIAPFAITRFGRPAAAAAWRVNRFVGLPAAVAAALKGESCFC